MNNPSSIIHAALQWAQEHLGDPGYAGLCYAFVEDAYELGGGVILDGQGTTATEAADAYCANKHHSCIPPVGAYVFYSCTGALRGETRDWGHVGLSLGDGRIIHAWNVVRQDGYLDVQRLDPAPGWTRAEYIGWVPVSTILTGSHPKAE